LYRLSLSIGCLLGYSVVNVLQKSSNNSLSQSDPVGTVVGTLAAVDTNIYDTNTFSLVSGTGSTNNASFTIDGTS
jgi:hypothetical protein